MRRYLRVVMVFAFVTLAAPVVEAGATCVPNSETLCLHDGRFVVTAGFLDTSAGFGIGKAARSVPFSNQTGAFWFFDAENLEIVVKVLNGCGLNGSYWVFIGGLTNVESFVQIVDTRNGGLTRLYANVIERRPFPTVQDVTAFPNCP